MIFYKNSLIMFMIVAIWVMSEVSTDNEEAIIGMK